MATITFKAKPECVYHLDDTLAYRIIKVPEFKRNHCDINSFRDHPRYKGLVNSDLFPSILKRIKRDITGSFNNHIRLDKLPPNVTVDISKFLAEVTITV